MAYRRRKTKGINYYMILYQQINIIQQSSNRILIETKIVIVRLITKFVNIRYLIYLVTF